MRVRYWNVEWTMDCSAVEVEDVFSVACYGGYFYISKFYGKNRWEKRLPSDIYSFCVV